MSNLRSPLARFAPLMHEPNPVAAKEAARKAWRDHGILVVDPGRYKESWVLQQEITNLGNRLYGKRPAK